MKQASIQAGESSCGITRDKGEKTTEKCDNTKETNSNNEIIQVGMGI